MVAMLRQAGARRGSDGAGPGAARYRPLARLPGDPLDERAGDRADHAPAESDRDRGRPSTASGLLHHRRRCQLRSRRLSRDRAGSDVAPVEQRAARCRRRSRWPSCSTAPAACSSRSATGTRLDIAKRATLVGDRPPGSRAARCRSPSSTRTPYTVRAAADASTSGRAARRSAAHRPRRRHVDLPRSRPCARGSCWRTSSRAAEACRGDDRRPQPARRLPRRARADCARQDHRLRRRDRLGRRASIDRRRTSPSAAAARSMRRPTSRRCPRSCRRRR